MTAPDPPGFAAVLAEDLRALAVGPFDCATVDMLDQAADRLDGVAALLRRCDEIERAGRGLGLGEAGQHISIAEVRALLGGADNNNEGERRG